MRHLKVFYVTLDHKHFEAPKNLRTIKELLAWAKKFGRSKGVPFFIKFKRYDGDKPIMRVKRIYLD